MADKAKAIKKTSRKKPAKKEVEIPILVLNSRKEEPGSAEKEIFSRETGEAGVFPKISEDENELPFFESVSVGEKEFSVPETEEETVKLMRETDQAKKDRHETEMEDENQKPVRGVEAWSSAKKKTVMWVSVTAFAAVIFLVWISVLGRNLSLDLGSNSYTYFRESVGSPEFEQSFSDIEEGWGNLENAAQEETDAPAADETLGKLQEKILVEEIKNKLENQ